MLRTAVALTATLYAAALAPAAMAQSAYTLSSGPSAAAPASDQLIPDSSVRRLAAADLDGRTKEELRIIRNEIYARKGYIFNSPDLRAYFGAKSWYVAREKNVKLNAVEEANVALLKAYER